MYFVIGCCVYLFFFIKQKTAYEMRISDWSSDVCSSDLPAKGTKLIFDGQVYDLVSASPHVRRDGSVGRILTWHSACARCGDDFIVTTGLRGHSINRR